MSKPDYKTWLAENKQKVEQGDVNEYLRWAVKNPSPAAGSFGRELTKPEAIRYAVTSAAHYFKGVEVQIRHTEKPDEQTRTVCVVAGTLVGQAHVAIGSATTEAIAVQTSSGALLVIPARNVADIENHDPR